jgi:hypothetical protein
MSHPLVVHNKKEAYDVYIGRPSKWGNPWNIGEHGSREEVIKLYQDWLDGKVGTPAHHNFRPPTVSEIKRELRGKILACWCAPQSCHGDILARIANG